MFKRLKKIEYDVEYIKMSLSKLESDLRQHIMVLKLPNIEKHIKKDKKGCCM